MHVYRLQICDLMMVQVVLIFSIAIPVPVNHPTKIQNTFCDERIDIIVYYFILSVRSHTHTSHVYVCPFTFPCSFLHYFGNISRVGTGSLFLLVLLLLLLLKVAISIVQQLLNLIKKKSKIHLHSRCYRQQISNQS